MDFFLFKDFINSKIGFLSFILFILNVKYKKFSDIEFIVVGEDINEAQLCEELKII